MRGKPATHGPHHVAQKSSTTTLPVSSAISFQGALPSARRTQSQ